MCLDGLDVHRFDRSVDWFEYIFHNRRTDDRLEHDVIIGPIANDTIFDTLGVISSGFLSSEDALKLLMIGPEYTQVAMKTEKAVKQLRWTGSEIISRPSLNVGEQVAYQEAFAKTLAEIVGQ